ncbi:MAG: efflux RND transporter periplasmic adaptor subunit [Rhodospirillales bacterium]|nr:MAG: efflux RND transporter periplasmic adaptor subunit [Rhodospirillales bacterium]
MKRSYLVAGGVAAAVAVWLATGLLSDGGGREPVRQIPASSEDELPAVRVADLVAEPHTRQLSLFGRTEADRTVQVRAETAGRVVEKLVRKGDRVAEGDVLVRLAIDDREARLREAEAVVEQRRIAHEASSALSRSGYRAGIGAAEDLAALAAARARLAAVQLDIERTEVRAPFDGIVETVAVDIGDVLDLRDPVATVVDLDPIKVVVEVVERKGGTVEIGSTADVRLVTGERLTGTVAYAARVANPSTRTFRVDLELPNPDGSIPDGVTAEVVMPLGTTMAHRISPALLALDDHGTVGVKRVVEDGTVVFETISIIDDTPDGMWVAGLPERSRLITVGQEFVRPGQRVRPVLSPGPALAAGSAAAGSAAAGSAAE